MGTGLATNFAAGLTDILVEDNNTHRLTYLSFAHEVGFLMNTAHKIDTPLTSRQLHPHSTQAN